MNSDEQQKKSTIEKQIYADWDSALAKNDVKDFYVFMRLMLFWKVL